MLAWSYFVLTISSPRLLFHLASSVSSFALSSSTWFQLDLHFHKHGAPPGPLCWQQSSEVLPPLPPSFLLCLKRIPVFLFCPIQYPPPNSWAELAASATSAAISSTWHQAHLSASKTLICIFDVLSHYFAFVTCVWHLVITLFLKAATASFPLSSFFSATSTSASPSFSPATASSSLQTL